MFPEYSFIFISPVCFTFDRNCVVPTLHQLTTLTHILLVIGSNDWMSEWVMDGLEHFFSCAPFFHNLSKELDGGIEEWHGHYLYLIETMCVGGGGCG